MGKLMGTSEVESFVAVANMFLGQTDSPILVSKYLGQMTDSEVMVVLVSGMGSMSVSILGGYTALGIPMEYLLIASTLVPVGSIMVAMVALVAAVNKLLGVCGISLQQVFSYVFAPFGFFLGLDPSEILLEGNLLGSKLVLNEFVAFQQLGGMISSMDYRTGMICAISLCGFANFSSLGICVSGIAVLCPEKKSTLARLVFKAMLGGVAVSLIGAMVVGLVTLFYGGRKMGKYKRIFVVVLDSLGIGAVEDSPEYGDVGVDTLGHIAQKVQGLKIPNLKKLGMVNLHPLEGMEPAEHPLGRYMRLKERSRGKDTMTGHWEMMGLLVTTPFQTFTSHGFPKELIDELEKRTGRKIIGNKSASGTEILDELAEEEIREGHLIVYTSADSVLQICGNEETMGLDSLYHYCEIARELTLRDEWKVGRVIARPYTGMKKGEFKRTSNRHDYALKPYGRTALNALKDAGYDVVSIGKIYDIFDGEGLTQSNHSNSSVHGMEQTIQYAKTDFNGLCFVNLVDFDALWGHRRNPEGYGRELERFDEKLGELLPLLGEDDLLILTADHGNDPTYTGTDHTREQVPFIAYSPSMEGGKDLGGADTFAVIGATVADNFGVKMPEGTIGTSVLDEL